MSPKAPKFEVPQFEKLDPSGQQLSPYTPKPDKPRVGPDLPLLHSNETVPGATASAEINLPSDESYVALVGLRRLVLATHIGRQKAHRNKIARRDAVFVGSVHRVHESASLQPHKDIDPFVPRATSLIERTVYNIRGRQARKQRHGHYEGQRIAFKRGPDFGTNKGNAEVLFRDIPKWEKKEHLKASRAYARHENGRLRGLIPGGHRRKARLDRAANAETRSARFREWHFSSLDDRIIRNEARLNQLREISEKQKIQREAHKDSLRQSKKFNAEYKRRNARNPIKRTVYDTVDNEAFETPIKPGKSERFVDISGTVSTKENRPRTSGPVKRNVYDAVDNVGFETNAKPGKKSKRFVDNSGWM